jgi:oxalate decarboxylase/phosphoglucose isomerase-like protein (cupin superfamily)
VPTTSSREDDPVTVEIEFSPGAQSILHIHPQQDESYEVISGKLNLYIVT